MSAIQEEVVVPRLKALVVDDSKLACFVLGRMLERQGFDVELAHSAEQALDTIEQLRHGEGCKLYDLQVGTLPLKRTAHLSI